MKDILSLNSNEFLNNINDLFKKYFSKNSLEKVNLFNYLPEDLWLKFKENGVLHPFVKEEYGGRKADQKEIQEVLRIAGNYGVPLTLRIGIEGALVTQPLLQFANDELIKEVMPKILNGEGGGLGITEPDASGSAVLSEMKSYFYDLGNGKIKIKGEKHWQGNSTSEFLLVTLKKSKDVDGNQLGKDIFMAYVPREYIKSTIKESEGLNAVRYALNEFDCEIPKRYLIEFSDSPRETLREFQGVFIRSRLQLIGMTHGIMEHIDKELKEETVRDNIDFVKRELNEINQRKNVSQLLYDYVCNTLKPVGSVLDKIMESNIVKSIATEYTYQAAQIAQKLMGAKGYEKGHPISKVALDIRPFTIFEGPNDMLFGEIYDQFSRLSKEEKQDGHKIKDETSILDKLAIDKRFDIKLDQIKEKCSEVYNFLNEVKIKTTNATKKVFLGRIVSKLFILGKVIDNKELYKFLEKEIRKDMLEFSYI